MQELNYLTMLTAIQDCIEKDKFYVGVFTKNKSNETNVFTEIMEIIIEENLQESIVDTVNNSNKSYITFKNGSHLTITVANENTRGHAFHMVLYEDGIHKYLVDYIIRPTEKLWRKGVM